MKVSSHNEWDPLRAVVVGTLDGFAPGLEYADSEGSHREAARLIAREAFPQWYLDEVAEDLDGLCATFRTAGVETFRPAWSERTAYFSTPNWAAEGFDIYNVRDLHIVFGNTIVSSAPSSRFRLFEPFALREVFYRHFFEEGFRWIAAPPPRLRGEYLHEIKRSATDLEAKEDSLHESLSHGLTEVYHYLDEDEVIFDAANIMRLGRDILFLVSSTGNRKAVRWLQEALGSEYRVHETHTYRSSHLDSTILPLREGTVLLNGARVSEQTCPDALKTWDKLFFTDMAPLPESEVEFHRSVRLPAYQRLKALGVESALGHISWPWAVLNVLSLDPNTVLVHDRQLPLIRALEAKGFTVIPSGCGIPTPCWEASTARRSTSSGRRSQGERSLGSGQVGVDPGDLRVVLGDRFQLIESGQVGERRTRREQLPEKRQVLLVVERPAPGGTVARVERDVPAFDARRLSQPGRDVFALVGRVGVYGHPLEGRPGKDLGREPLGPRGRSVVAGVVRPVREKVGEHTAADGRIDHGAVRRDPDHDRRITGAGGNEVPVEHVVLGSAHDDGPEGPHGIRQAVVGATQRHGAAHHVDPRNGPGPGQDMREHRSAAQVLEDLPRKPARPHPGLDDDDNHAAHVIQYVGFAAGAHVLVRRGRHGDTTHS